MRALITGLLVGTMLVGGATVSAQEAKPAAEAKAMDAKAMKAAEAKAAREAKAAEAQAAKEAKAQREAEAKAEKVRLAEEKKAEAKQKEEARKAAKAEKSKRSDKAAEVKPGRIRGYLVDAAGKGLYGIVALKTMDGTRVSLHETNANENGVFEIEGVMPGRYKLHVQTLGSVVTDMNAPADVEVEVKSDDVARPMLKAASR
jgi:hypothetical protein